MLEIRDLCTDNLRTEAMCCEEEQADFRNVAEEKMAWLKEMMSEGLRAKIAYEDGKPAGFIEYMPIHLAPKAVTGKDITFVTCIWVVSSTPEERPSGFQGRGYGKALLEAAETDAKKISRGIALGAFDHDHWFTPASFFTRLGYKEVDRRGSYVLLFKPFKAVKPPFILQSKYEPQFESDKVVIDAFWSATCPMSLVVRNRLREVCSELADKVTLNEICTSRRSVVEKYGKSSGTYIDGQAKFWAPPSKDELRETIVKALEEAESR